MDGSTVGAIVGWIEVLIVGWMDVVLVGWMD